MYVLDSSVALKWFILEADSGVARKLRAGFLDGHIELAAPDLLLYEVSNVLVRKKRIRASEVEGVIGSLFELGIAVSAPDVAQVKRAARIAASTGASVYDSIYVALAAELECALVTADERLASLCGAVADIRLLGDLEGAGLAQ